MIKPAPVTTGPEFSISRQGDGEGGFVWRVRGDKPERWVRQTDFSNDEAVGYLADRLARLGVEEELIKAGATSGSTVMIGADDDAVVFDWYPTIRAGDPSGASPRGTDARLDARLDELPRGDVR